MRGDDESIWTTPQKLTKYLVKLEKATDSQRQAKDIRMAYEEIIKARI